MKLDSLKLTNFRGFSEFEITFDPSFTVLLGGNMAGKSAVLVAAVLGLSRGLGGNATRGFDADEVHKVVVSSGGIPELQWTFPVRIEAKIIEDGFGPGWELWHLVRNAAHLPTKLPPVAYSVLNRRIDEPLPIVALYGVDRHWDREQPADDVRGVGSRDDGYIGLFDVRSSHALMAGWMRKQTYVELQQGNGYRQPQLAAVEAAVTSCVDEVVRFWFDVQYDELRLERAGRDIQSFSMLSEGYRNMVAMVADIARRASVLNPQHGREAHLLTEGVVLIDELDLHLHPAWQRRIVEDLRRTFPKIQFIVTTHSPQIVASVSRSQIRLLDRNQLIAEKPYVQGRSTDEILEDVFGVAARPEAIQAEIDALYQLIEDEDYAAARAHLAALQERLGPDDAAMIKARWILETEDPHPPTQPSQTP